MALRFTRVSFARRSSLSPSDAIALFGARAESWEKNLSQSPDDLDERCRAACGYAAEFFRRKCREHSSFHLSPPNRETWSPPLQELHSLASRHCQELVLRAASPASINAVVANLLHPNDPNLFPLAARLITGTLALNSDSLLDFQQKGPFEERATIYHYATALNLLKSAGCIDEARSVFEEAVALELPGATEPAIRWTELWQTPVVCVENLRPVMPWWETSALSQVAQILADNAKIIQSELDVLLDQGHNNLAHPAYPFLTAHGRWHMLPLYTEKRWDPQMRKLAPRTCELLEHALPGAAAGLPYVHHNTEEITFFSMLPGTHVRTHNGGSNVRLNLSLGLRGCEGSWLAVGPPGSEPRPWREGEVLAFDDSCDHSAWHDGPEERWVLAVGIMHPDLVQQPWLFQNSISGRTKFETIHPSLATASACSKI